MNKTLIAFGLLCLIGSMLCIEGGRMASLEGKRVVMVIAHENFRDEEFQEPYELLTSLGASVEIASTSLEEAKGMLGKRVKPTMLLEDVDPNEFDAVIFVGGSGAANYFNDSTALGLARKAYEAGKVVAAICIAPVILANAGVLRGKRATVWDGDFVKQLEANGASYTGNSVEIDGKVITANGPHAARQFAEAIAKLLGGE